MLGTWLRALYSHATLAVLSWRVGTRSRDADPEFALPPFLLDQPEPTKLSRIGRLLPLARFREYHRSLSVPMGDAWQRLRAELAWLVHGSHWSCIRFPEPRIRRALHGDRKQEDLRGKRSSNDPPRPPSSPGREVALSLSRKGNEPGSESRTSLRTTRPRQRSATPPRTPPKRAFPP
jgi:hypothetical protein